MDPFKYDYDTDEFFENDYDSELDRSRLVNSYAGNNYMLLVRNGVHPLDAMSIATDAAVVEANLTMNPDWGKDKESFAPIAKFWEILRSASSQR